MPVVHLGDLEMNYQLLGQGRIAVLALHPSTVPGAMFSWAVPKPARFRVYLPDQRGHGNTNNPDGVLHMPLLMDDITGFVEAMELESCHAIGYSMGANVLLHLAAYDPEFFESLVLIGSSFKPPNEEAFAKVTGQPLAARTGLAAEVLHPDRGIQNGWSVTLRDLENITCPTVIVAGDRDPISPPEEMAQMYRALPDGNLLIIPTCGHFGYHTNPMVQAFLKGWYDER